MLFGRVIIFNYKKIQKQNSIQTGTQQSIKWSSHWNSKPMNKSRTVPRPQPNNQSNGSKHLKNQPGPPFQQNPTQPTIPKTPKSTKPLQNFRYQKSTPQRGREWRRGSCWNRGSERSAGAAAKSETYRRKERFGVGVGHRSNWSLPLEAATRLSPPCFEGRGRERDLAFGQVERFWLWERERE